VEGVEAFFQFLYRNSKKIKILYSLKNVKKCFHSFHPYHHFLDSIKNDCVNGKEIVKRRVEAKVDARWRQKMLPLLALCNIFVALQTK
jgi:hypothetical protein